MTGRQASLTSVAVPSFDLFGPLPAGTTVLEASAGTGKTHTVGALVTRYVAEGHALLDELLVVTFGRTASLELRERVREQLIAAARALADPQAARTHPDELIARLAGADGADPEQVRERHRRLVRALAEFDAATIATTHQFCQQVLFGLGIAGDSEPTATLVEDLDDLVEEVADDLYVRKFGVPNADEPAFTREQALNVAKAAVGNSQAKLEPAGQDPQSLAAMLFRYATAVRAEVEERKRRRGILGYDDLLSRVAHALAEPDAPARSRMRARWRVVLIDEFQDTDPVQWEVIRLAFHRHATVILIGDPKQAIYAFRGGDVTTYLAAARQADRQATLDQNWRADGPLVRSLQALFDGAALGDEEIVVRPITAARTGSRLDGVPVEAPIRLRVLAAPRGARKPPKVDEVRPRIAADAAADIARLLAAGATFDGRPLTAGDVAVLVGTRMQARIIRDALAAAGVPSVLAAAGNVFGSAAAEDWLTLLEALEQPHRSARVRAAALTAFLGLSVVGLDAGGEQLTDTLGEKLRRWADLVIARGVATLLELADTEEDMPGRVLAHLDGERELTDLRHIGQDLQTIAMRDGLGLAALVEWLRRQRDVAAQDQSAERLRRLDSEARAVQVLTVHASKGLQFPVVYLPFAFDRYVDDAPDLLTLHDRDGQRLLDVGGSGSTGRADRLAQALAEEAGEALRLTYVALTRAQSQVVIWWASSYNTRGSGLHRLLLGRRAGTDTVADNVPVPSDESAVAAFRELEQRGGPVVELIPQATSEPPGLPAPQGDSTRLQIGRFRRGLDTAWRRASYSALSAAARSDAVIPGGGMHNPAGPGTAGALTATVTAGGDPGVSSEPETGERDDEQVDGDLPPAGPVSSRVHAADPDARLREIPSPMADLPTGTTFGTLVHAVLEELDPGVPDLAAELLARCRQQLTRRVVPVTAAELAEALLPVLRTPLGPLASGASLAEIAVRDRLAELDFELPLAGGDRPENRLLLGDLAPLLRLHLPADDPLVGYADRLAAPEMATLPLRGYLTGSLDAVLRLPGPRYLVADYKTNWLGEPGEPLTAWHYRQDALKAAMAHSDYPLQAMLYCVALHRYLRWRQPDYSPVQHLGGVLYLYVRGMTGPATDPDRGSAPSGVFGWQPPAALVLALSAALDEGTS